MFLIIISILPFYLIGCFPSGFIIAKFNNIDITKNGSGNVGATNIARTLGAKAGLLTLILDVLKGFLAVLIATIIGLITPLAALSVVAGHCFSIPGKLKGGKGVATALGVLVFLSPKLTLIALLIFIFIFILTKYVSLASMLATGITALSTLALGYDNGISMALIGIASIVIFRHKDNIEKLVMGTEAKFKAKKN